MFQWDTDAVRDDLLTYVREQLAERGAIVVIDETGFPKKGTKSAGVKQQYSGQTRELSDRVFVAYSTRRVYVLLDHELYLPQEWTEN